jgi:hypothetical protein
MRQKENHFSPIFMSYRSQNSKSPRRLLLLLRVVVHRCLGVDDHVFRIVAANLSVVVVAVLGMPRRRQRAELFTARVLEALQLHLVFFAAAGAALIGSASAAAVRATGRALQAVGGVVGGFEAQDGHDLAEERAESRAAGGGDSESGFGAGPEGDVGGGVEEVGFVGESVNVGDAGDGCDGGSVVGFCQFCSVLRGLGC